ncbi:transglutaminase family protein [Sphingomonas montanisoli]|uniref:Transglutaminase family protein n=1 Tax=Sphingomonas montanisoli TaxID=2606412 RepID=A0A5D9C383_9SPHN|nr:transglutaminase family protein [Sphingomonas montanisoli]TZG25742.1 transglutaminase family protein [Sphingomonas montanisoli]
MRLTITHRTAYHYRRPVALQPHRLLVTPRAGAELRLLDLVIDTGGAATIAWTDDVFGNRIATLNFPQPADAIEIIVTATIEHDAPPFPIFTIAVDAHHYPFAYSQGDRIDLGALLTPQPGDGAETVAAWARGFVAGGRTDTLALLKDLNAGLLPAIAYRTRDEEGTQAPAETLARASGSCRDIAALFIDAARHLGFGARAVSGYLHDPEQTADDPGSTHGWAEIYLPAAGWITFDPTHNRVGDAQLIPVAVARHIRQIMPVTGGYIGTPDDASGMTVSVRVAAG